MKVTHVNFARGFRGGERQTFNLIEGLASQGVQQTLICRNNSELSRRVSAMGLKAVEVRHPLLGHVSPPQSDLIHAHEARGAYWAALEKRLRHTPYVITRRIPNPISGSRLTASVYANAQKLFGVSRDVSARLSRQTGLPVDTILSSSTGLEATPDLVRQIRSRLGGGPVIGHVGALHDRHKGQSVLIRAFQTLLANYPEARLVLVGDGVDRDEFEKLAQGDKRIHFAGFQEDVGAWIASMDVFCFPSREEGLGSSVLDAMSLRIPVIAAAVGGLPELMGRNERGTLLGDHEPANWARMIMEVLRRKQDLEASLDAAQAFAANNGVAAMTKSYLAIYEQILVQRALVSQGNSVMGVGH